MDTRSERFNRLVGDVMRSEIRMSGRSVRQAASDLEMDRSVLTRYLDGNRHIPVSVVYAVAALVEMQPEQLVRLARIRLDETSMVELHEMPREDIGWGEGDLPHQFSPEPETDTNIVRGRFGTPNVSGADETDDLLAAASDTHNTREDDRTDEHFFE